MSARVFRRSASPNPPVAVRGRMAPTIGGTRTVASNLDAGRRARSVVKRRPMGRPRDRGRPPRKQAAAAWAYGPRQRRSPTEPAGSAYAVEVGRHLPVTDRRDLPGVRGSEGDRDRAQSSAPRPRRSPAASRKRLESCSPAGAATTATRWAALDLSGTPAAAVGPYEGLAGAGFRHVKRPAYPLPRAGLPGSAGACHHGGAGRRSWTGRSRRRAPGTVGRVPSGSRFVGADAGCRPSRRRGKLARPSRRCAATHGVLLIADEVMTGFRSHRWPWFRHGP